VGRVSFTKTKLNNRPVRVLSWGKRTASGELGGSHAALRAPPLNGDEPARRRSFTVPCMARTWKLEVQQNPWMCAANAQVRTGHWGNGKFRNAAEQIRMS